jgi:cytochrome oxidase assembly protein ShyY1
MVEVGRELDCPDVIVVVNRGHIPRATRDRATRPKPCQPQQDVDYTATIGAHHHGGT